jgi:large-conductance mechanosensitive channel
MADDNPDQTEGQQLTKAELKRRKVKEVKTKLANLSPAAAAEVMEAAVANQARKQVSGFADFLREQSVIGVGIGIVFGTQVKAVVDVLMLQFVEPITKLILPGDGGLAKQTVTRYINDEKIVIGWGAIVYSLLTFIIVAAIIYAAYKGLKLDKFKKRDK